MCLCFKYICKFLTANLHAYILINLKNIQTSPSVVVTGRALTGSCADRLCTATLDPNLVQTTSKIFVNIKEGGVPFR